MTYINVILYNTYRVGYIEILIYCESSSHLKPNKEKLRMDAPKKDMYKFLEEEMDVLFTFLEETYSLTEEVDKKGWRDPCFLQLQQLRTSLAKRPSYRFELRQIIEEELRLRLKDKKQSMKEMEWHILGEAMRGNLFPLREEWLMDDMLSRLKTEETEEEVQS